MKSVLLILALLLSLPPRIAALPPPEAVDAGELFVVWVVVFSDEAVGMATTVPSVVELLSVTDATPAGMTGMRWRRYSYTAPAGVYFLDYTACGAGGCASARAFVRIGQQLYLPLIQR